MVLQFYYLPANGQAFTIGDDAYAHPISSNYFQWGAGGNVTLGFMPDQDVAVDIVPLVRSAYAAVLPRYNLVERFTLTVEREFNTYELADAFVNYHGKNFPASGEIMKIETSPSGSTRSWLKNAVTARRPKCLLYQGVRNIFSYEFAAPNPWQNTP